MGNIRGGSASQPPNLGGSVAQYLEKHGFAAFCPKAVLFDMDGVIYDSMPNHALAWHESMAACGLAMAPEEVYQVEGMRGVETIQMLARRQWGREVPAVEAQQMYQRKSALYASLPTAAKMHGIDSLMRQIADGGLTVGIVTGSGQQTLLSRLLTDFDGILRPEHIVTSYDVSRGKPSPEPYQAGMRKVGTRPCETIVVENAPLGVRAAVAAGCFTIAVNTGPLPDSTLAAEGASLVLASISQLADKWTDIINLTNKL